MPLRRLGLIVAVALACGGCKKDRTKSAVTVGNAAPLVTFKDAGAAHAGAIDQVSLSVDRSIAVTRDVSGGLRLWPRLDGSAEPIAVPARGAQHFSAAAERGGSFIVATVEASGQAVFTRVRPGSDPQQLIALPPFEPVVEAHVLPGGDKILTLHRDATIRLLRTNGQEIGRFSRRKFSPTQLRVSADGKRMVAIETGATVGSTLEVLVYPIEMTGNPQRLFVGRDPLRLRTPFAPTPESLAMSPDGRSLATLTPNRSQRELIVLVYDLAATGRRRSFPTKLSVGSQAVVGFVGPESISVSTPGRRGVAVQIDTRTGRSVPRRPPPDGVTALQTAGGVQIGAYDSWLFVQDLTKSTQRYLGYEAFHPTAVAFSPSGQWIAWGTERSEIYVEPFAGGGTPKKLERNGEGRVDQLYFVDDAHVLALLGRHRIALMDWKQDRVVDETSVDSQSMSELQYEPDTQLLLLNGSRDGKRIVEIVGIDGGRGFGGQYILPDGAPLAGLLSKQAGKSAVMWTASRDDSKIRMYTLVDLRRGLSEKDVKDRGSLMPPGDLLHIDRQGSRYVFDAGRLTVMRGAQTATVELPTRAIQPSWDGRRVFAVVSDGHRDLRLVAYAADTMDEVWSQRLPVNILSFAWSRSGTHVGVATESGGVVVDARDGKQVGARCGLSFESRGAPPDRSSRGSIPSLCDG